MLESDLHTQAHYRLLASSDLNCSFSQEHIVLDKHLIPSFYSPKGELDDGTYCFTVAEYDPASGSYGLWSKPRVIRINAGGGG